MKHESDLRLWDILRRRDHVSFPCAGIIITKIVGHGCAHPVNQLVGCSHTSRNLVVVGIFCQVAHQLIALHLEVLQEDLVASIDVLRSDSVEVVSRPVIGR